MPGRARKYFGASSSGGSSAQTEQNESSTAGPRPRTFPSYGYPSRKSHSEDSDCKFSTAQSIGGRRNSAPDVFVTNRSRSKRCCQSITAADPFPCSPCKDVTVSTHALWGSAEEQKQFASAQR